MVTGDHGLTAEAIAIKIGVVTEARTELLTGADLAAIDDASLQTRLRVAREGGLIFARAAPADKLRIVNAFKTLDEIVAVTGDGVNDAPALKRADIGIAMGLSGTNVAEEAAVMVLLDDSFATIVKAIERGRSVYNNVRLFLVYHFTHNLGELLLRIRGAHRPRDIFSIGFFSNRLLVVAEREDGAMDREKHEPRPGDAVEIHGHRIGEPARTAEILEVLGAAEHPHFRVRWEDGHESIFYPSSDAIVRPVAGRGSTSAQRRRR